MNKVHQSYFFLIDSLGNMVYIGSMVELSLVIMQELVAELLVIPKLDVNDGRLAMR